MKILKVLGITIFLVVCITMCMNGCDDEPITTEIEIMDLPEGTYIENTNTELDKIKGQFVVSGDFRNDSGKDIPTHQITVDLYDKDGNLIFSPITSTGVAPKVKAGQTVGWYVNYPTIERPAKAKITLTEI